jgi:hypothetical protein
LGQNGPPIALFHTGGGERCDSEAHAQRVERWFSGSARAAAPSGAKKKRKKVGIGGIRCRDRTGVRRKHNSQSSHYPTAPRSFNDGGPSLRPLYRASLETFSRSAAMDVWLAMFHGFSSIYAAGDDKFSEKSYEFVREFRG